MGRQVTTTGHAASDAGAGARGIAAGGGQRTLQRHRGFRGYINLNARGQAGNPTAPGQILQNFLGSNPQDLITQGLRRGTPLLVDFGFAILDSLENEMPDLSDGVLGAGGRAALSTIPSALVRWDEESRVIDGDSRHDCVTALKPAIVDVIEKVREEELAERRAKKKKSKEEEEAKKKADDAKAAQEQATSGNRSSSALNTTNIQNAEPTAEESEGGNAIIPDEISMQPPAQPMAQPISIQDLSSMAPNESNTITEMLTPAQQQEEAVRSALQSITSSVGGTASLIHVDNAGPGSARTMMQYQQPTNDVAMPNAISGGVPPLPPSFQQPPAFATLLAQQSPLPPNGENISLIPALPTPPTNELAASSPNEEVDVLMTSEQPSSQELMTQEPVSIQSSQIWQDNIEGSVLTQSGAAQISINPLVPESPPLTSNETISVSNDTELLVLPSAAVSRIQASESRVAEANTNTNGNDQGAAGAAASTPTTDPVAGPSGTSTGTDDLSSVLGININDLPEGVDPSFLAALPEDMR